MERLIDFLQRAKSNKPLIVSLVVIFLIIVIILIVFRQQIFNPDKVYHDPLSGETIYDPADRTPETYNQTERPNYLGFSALSTRGLTFETVEVFKSQLGEIKDVNGEKITEVSVDIDSIEHTMSSSSHSYTFRIRINRKYDYKTILTVNKLTEEATFTLTDMRTEELFYDSKKHDHEHHSDNLN